ncbi:molybdate ABC transporter substrate-binding protein [Prosthecochloris sp. ZM_2]|uniref:molybdate ABC transporter substrate-binding protein n=1 Tax=Prosthecochloris sp. ZM_2 TaxID=2045206 RepID=UPI000DF79287|nr:molybdate ABC transporter substrate-binding protein [Prosthecochloris sp. ZM_2]RNA64341.1 molybdate ABC transporter substrate-binding protein [Prosthecochloris sp. ZM_2]
MNRMLHRFSLFFMLLSLVALGGCTREKSADALSDDVLHIAAAANLSYVISPLVDDFRRRYPEYAGLDIEVTKASSGSLTAQIRNGAPYDVFLAANMSYPEALHAEGLTRGEPVTYAIGIPVLVCRRELATSDGPDVLAGDGVRAIAVAQPELAPYGEAALAIVESAGLLEELRPRLVYSSSVAQAFQQAVTAADAGFIAKSLLFGDKGRELQKAGMVAMEFAPETYSEARLRQAMVLLDGESESAQKFFSYIQGEGAQRIFLNNGYRLP